MTKFTVGMRVAYVLGAGGAVLVSFAGLHGTVIPPQGKRQGVCVKWDNGIIEHHSNEYLRPLWPAEDEPSSPEVGMDKVLVGQIWKPKAYRGKSIVSTVTVRKVTDRVVCYKWNDSATLTGTRKITQFLDEWELVEATSLPPAPHSVRYYPNSAQPHVHITVEQYKDSAGSFIAVDSAVIGSCVSQYLEPDTALQLAHDLMRMALKLKREQEG